MALLLYPLERDVVVPAATGRGRLFRKRLRGGGSARAGGALGATHELHALGDDLGDGALAAVLAFPVTCLQASLDEDLAALVEVLAARLGLLAPDDDREEASFLPLLAGLSRVVAVHRQPEIRDGGAARRVAQLRWARQVPDEHDLVQARH